MRVAVTGATGYIGGRLVPALLEAGHDVVCLARTPDKLADRPWTERVSVRSADVLDPERLEDALAGCDAAYYLVHSMGSASEFTSADRDGARNFAEAAAAAGVRRIVYLGGLGSEEDDLSKHLTSRHEVGVTLASTGVPVTELRAAVIIGSGSVSFEMLRHLTEVLPVMVTPSWVRTRCQPIAIRDVLRYLVDALGDEERGHAVYEIGGPDVVTYEEMMQTYAEVAGLPRRLVVPVPVLSPRLSSYWIGFVTPLPVGVARPLVDSLRNEVVVRSRAAADRFGPATIDFRTAVELAVGRSGELHVPTRWSDAASAPARSLASDPDWSGDRMFVDHRTATTTASAEDLFWAFSRVGGDAGYYGFGWAWALRGILDTLVGGVGLRRGRRHPEEVRLGDTVDFWRVAAVERNRLLQLWAEMRLPGEAWLEWRIEDEGTVRTLHQTAYFRPRGLSGRLYWFALLPFHGPIFRGMARSVVEAAERRQAGVTSRTSPGRP